MKKFLLILSIGVFLMGCQKTINGTWFSPEGDTEISFEDSKVIFFGVEGTYERDKDDLIIYIGSQELRYKYKLDDNQLIIFLDDGDLLLERK